jgi:hypothetical protein
MQKNMQKRKVRREAMPKPRQGGHNSLKYGKVSKEKVPKIPTGAENKDGIDMHRGLTCAHKSGCRKSKSEVPEFSGSYPSRKLRGEYGSPKHVLVLQKGIWSENAP